MGNLKYPGQSREYLEGRIQSATPVELVRMLYELVLDEIATARECLANGDAMARSKAVSKAVQGLTELMVSLDTDKGGPRAQRLREVYGFLQNELLRAHADQSEERFASVVNVVGTMYRNWLETCSILNRQETTQSAPAPAVAAEVPESSKAESTEVSNASKWGMAAGSGETNRGWEA